MPAPQWEDLDAFLQLDDFAVPAVITRQVGAPLPVVVIFDDPNVNADLGDAYTRDDVRPTANGKETAMPGVKRGDTITITFPAGAQTFDILAAPMPDGTGMAKLALARQ